MKAAIYTTYGPPDVLRIEDVPAPIPKADEVLIRVRASSVCFGDLMARNFRAVTPRTFPMPGLFWLFAKLAFGVFRPRTTILGAELSGTVEAVGAKVTRFSAGDEVFAYPGQRFGAYAQYTTMRETAVIAHKPTTLSFEEAAVIPYGATTALALLDHAAIQPGQRVLINGASGSIGSRAVQLARHYGAEVTAVCGTPRLAYVKALGADHAIDYTAEDFTQNGITYDLIFDIPGKSSFSRCKNSLTPSGIYMPVSFKTPALLQSALTRFRGGKRVLCTLAPESQHNLQRVRDLADQNVLTPIIDITYPLEAIQKAHTHAESRTYKASIALTIPHQEKF